MWQSESVPTVWLLLNFARNLQSLFCGIESPCHTQTLSIVGMPKGGGRKGEKPPRKKKKTKTAPVEQDVPCNNSMEQEGGVQQLSANNNNVQWKVDAYPHFVSTQQLPFRIHG